jgi:hypothetical protein
MECSSSIFVRERNAILVSLVMFAAIPGAMFYCDGQTAEDVMNKCHYLDSLPSYSAELDNLALGTNMSHGATLSVVQKVFGRLNQDGTRQSRVETDTSIHVPSAAASGFKIPQIPSTIFITTADGETWSLDSEKKEAVRLSYLKDAQKTLLAAMQEVASNADPVKPGEASDVLGTDVIDGQPCFKVTRSFGKEMIKQQLDTWKSPAFENVKKKAAQRIVAKREIWVREGDWLIIQTCTFDPDGLLISGVKYSSIVIGSALRDDLFKIPQEYKRTAVKSGWGLAEQLKPKVRVLGMTGSPLDTARQGKREVLIFLMVTMPVALVGMLIWYSKNQNQKTKAER